MTVSPAAHPWLHSASFWIRWLLLEMFGPASLDEKTDPIQQLKREYGRPAHRPPGRRRLRRGSDG